MPDNRPAPISFEVGINNDPPITAHVPHGVLSAIATWVMRNPAAWNGDGSVEEWSAEAMEFSLGGIDGVTDEHVEWVRRSLVDGDEITIRIVPAGDHDAPIRRHRWTEQSLRFRQLNELIDILGEIVEVDIDQTCEPGSSEFVAFLNILSAFEAEYPEIVSSIRPVDALTAGELLTRARVLLSVIDQEAYRE